MTILWNNCYCPCLRDEVQMDPKGIIQLIPDDTADESQDQDTI